MLYKLCEIYFNFFAPVMKKYFNKYYILINTIFLIYLL